jgi:hypothetical protein
MHVSTFTRNLALFAVVAICGSSSRLYAQAHVVSLADLQKEVVSAAKTRQDRVDQVTRFLSSDRAKKAFSSAGIDAKQVTNAIATLSDEELTQLSTRASKAQADFAAGTLTDHDLTLIILAIAILVLLIVAIR